MPAQKLSNRALDALAISLSGACIVHCLILPVILSVLPMTTFGLENEWVHKTLVLVAIPVTLLAILSFKPSSKRPIFIGVLVLGISLLVAGSFFEIFHDYEAVLTLFGGCLLISGHIGRWRLHGQS